MSRWPRPASGPHGTDPDAGASAGGLDTQEVALLLAHARSLKDRAALSIACGCGLRVSKIAHLKVADIDSARMLIRVEQGKGPQGPLCYARARPPAERRDGFIFAFDLLAQLTRLFRTGTLNVSTSLFIPCQALNLKENAMTARDTLSTENIDGLIAGEIILRLAMDARTFATIFDPTALVTRRGDGDSVVVTPIAAWLNAVRSLTSPKDAGSARADQILSSSSRATWHSFKLRLWIPPREVTDLLSCFCLNGRWQIVQKVFAAEPLA